MKHKHHDSVISWLGGDIFSLSFNRFEYYAMHDYLPSKYFSNDDLLDKDKAIRNYIWKFKDGQRSATDKAIEEITELIEEKFELDNVVFIPIPASTKDKTKSRFRRFCHEVANKLEVENGYGAITTEDHEPKKGSSGNKIEHFTFNPDIYKGKNVILFDDIITTESTFKQTADELIESGAKSVKGVFLAKTVHEYNE